MLLLLLLLLHPRFQNESGEAFFLTANGKSEKENGQEKQSETI